MTRCRELKERAEARSQDARAQEEFARYDRSRVAFEDALSELGSVDDLARASRDADIAILPPADDREWATKIASELREKLPNATGHEVEQLANMAGSAVKVLAANTANQFDAELQRWCDRQPSPSEHVLDLLEPLAPQPVSATRHAAAQFRQLIASRPTTGLEVAQIAAAAGALREAYTDFAAAAPDGVSDFLERAPTGVPLNQVDLDILEWLYDNEVTSGFEVRSRR